MENELTVPHLPYLPHRWRGRRLIAESCGLLWRKTRKVWVDVLGLKPKSGHPPEAPRSGSTNAVTCSGVQWRRSPLRTLSLEPDIERRASAVDVRQLVGHHLQLLLQLVRRRSLPQLDSLHQGMGKTAAEQMDCVHLNV